MQLLLSHVEKKMDLSTQVMDLSVYGHRATTERMHQAAMQVHGCNMTAGKKARLTAQVRATLFSGR